MLVAIIFAHVWGVVQLTVLGSFTRTLRVRTLLAAMAVGFFSCAPFAVLLQVTWLHLAAWLTGADFYVLLRPAAYTLDPFIEEIVKLLPIALLLTVPMTRRQWSLTDYVLVGAAIGSGFGLAEALYRYGASPHQANPIDGGWMMATSLELPTVPSAWTTLTSWLPSGAAGELRPGELLTVNLHLAWSAIGGLAVGLMVAKRIVAVRAVSVVLLLFIGLDHAAYNLNGSIYSSWLAPVATPLELLNALVALMPAAALVVAWWVDRKQQSVRGDDEVTLSAEQRGSWRLGGTLRAAVSRLPGSLATVYVFTRLRRTYGMRRAFGSSDPDTQRFRALVVSARDRAEQALTSPQSLSRFRAAFLFEVIRRPKVIVGLVLMTPSFLWFVAGGWPQTAGLQAAMNMPIAWTLVVAFSVLIQCWLALQVINRVRLWRRARYFPVGDDAAMLGFQIALGVGAVSLGGLAISRAFTGLSPTSNLLHAVNAFGSSPTANSLQVANSAVGAISIAIAAEGNDAHAKKETAVDWWMSKWFGTPGNPGFLQIHPNDGIGTKLARAAGIVVLLPVWGVGVFVANGVDELRGGGPFHFWGH